jgi:hypothetical protein
MIIHGVQLRDCVDEVLARERLGFHGLGEEFKSNRPGL